MGYGSSGGWDMESQEDGIWRIWRMGWDMEVEAEVEAGEEGEGRRRKEGGSLSKI